MNLEYADALSTAAHHSFFKFMVKSTEGLTANGCHARVSVWDAERKVIAYTHKAKELGLSDQGRHFLGSIMKHAEALAAIVSHFSRWERETTLDI